MGFKDPSDGGIVDPEAGKYTARCVYTEDGDDYGNGPTIWWAFNLATSDGPVLDVDGEPAVWKQLTSTSLGPKAKGGIWARAFLNSDLAGWSGQQVSDALPGSMATVLIGPVADSQGQMRMRILSATPIGAPAAPAAKKSPAAQAAPSADPFAIPA